MKKKLLDGLIRLKINSTPCFKLQYLLFSAHLLLVIPSKSNFICLSDACEVMNHVTPARRQMDWKNTAISKGHLSHFYPISLSMFSCVSKPMADSPTYQMPQRITTPWQYLQKVCVAFEP